MHNHWFVDLANISSWQPCVIDVIRGDFVHIQSNSMWSKNKVEEYRDFDKLYG